MTEILPGSPIVNAVGHALVGFVWQGAVIGIATALLLGAARRATSNTRYLIACFGLVLLVATPIVTVARHLDELPAPAGGEVAPGVPESTATVDTATPISSSEVSSAPWPARVDASLPFLVLAWGLGVMTLTLRLVGGWMKLDRIRRSALRHSVQVLSSPVRRLSAELRVSKPVRLARSALVEVPIVIGWLRPTILVPVGAFAGLSTSQVEAIIAHELAHIRRQDYLVNGLQSVVETVLFYHPAVWWVSRQIRIEREHCCDDLAADLCGDRVAYAAALTSLEEVRHRAVAVGVAATGGELLPRVRRLLGRPSVRSEPRASLIACVALTVVSLVVVRVAAGGTRQDPLPAVPTESEVAVPATPSVQVPSPAPVVVPVPPSSSPLAVDAPARVAPRLAPEAMVSPRVVVAPIPSSQSVEPPVAVAPEPSVRPLIAVPQVPPVPPTPALQQPASVQPVPTPRVQPGGDSVGTQVEIFRLQVHLSRNGETIADPTVSVGSDSSGTISLDDGPRLTLEPYRTDPAIVWVNVTVDSATPPYRVALRLDGQEPASRQILDGSDTVEVTIALVDSRVGPGEQSTADPRPEASGRRPQPVQTVGAIYPAAARATQLAGHVDVRAVVLPDGTVDQATVWRSCLTDAAEREASAASGGFAPPLPVRCLDQAELAEARIDPTLGLGQAAVDAVRQWTFTPAIVDGDPVSVIAVVRVRFGPDSGAAPVMLLRRVP